MNKKTEDYKPNLTEGQLKRQVEDYLQYGKNQGKWWSDRLNSGVAYIKRGSKYYAIKLCEEGTSDFYVLRSVNIGGASFLKLMFLELKSEKGKQRPEQVAFQKIVEEQGASYFIIHSIEDLENILEVNNGS